jgi:hypothetical protein
MSLILAVEPDRRQSAHLTHIVRQRVGAELILAETTELALASIGNRVPDLILVPALMSPQDDAALGAALRVIATAAHVQMLTTPLFAAAAPAPRGRGVLGVFRRSRPAKASPDGCDPAEFAQQISSYLQSAVEERTAAQHVPPQLVSAPPPIVDSSGRYMPLDATRLYRDEHPTHQQLEAAPATEAIPEPVAATPEYESVAELVEPVAEIDEPIVAMDEPVVAVAEPAAGIIEPVAEVVEPIVAFEPEQLSQASVVMHEAIDTVSETPAPESIAEPIAALREPIDETAEPLLEAPEPMGAAADFSQRRIGFVPEAVRDEEVDQPIAIAASVDDTPVLEVIAETEAVALSEPIADEAIELFEVVSDDDDEEGAIDLSAEFAAFDRAQSLEAEATEVDAEAVEVLEIPEVEILETPEIIEAIEPIATRAHAIQADPLQEFAAALEAMTAVDPAGASGESVAAEPVNFDDLFPPRQPVEPSPLSAWRSWTPLEGITAEAAPVPAHVVERAAERPPERPDWVQLVESLRVDVERRRSEQPSAAPKPARKAPSRPMQDEWGLFDPEQCGFAALLEKLDEITEANESRPRRSA